MMRAVVTPPTRSTPCVTHHETRRHARCISRSPAPWPPSANRPTANTPSAMSAAPPPTTRLAPPWSSVSWRCVVRCGVGRRCRVARVLWVRARAPHGCVALIRQQRHALWRNACKPTHAPAVHDPPPPHTPTHPHTNTTKEHLVAACLVRARDHGVHVALARCVKLLRARQTHRPAQAMVSWQAGGATALPHAPRARAPVLRCNSHTQQLMGCWQRGSVRHGGGARGRSQRFRRWRARARANSAHHVTAGGLGVWHEVDLWQRLLCCCRCASDVCCACGVSGETAVSLQGTQNVPTMHAVCVGGGGGGG
jgi:hypothetical protein